MSTSPVDSFCGKHRHYLMDNQTRFLRQKVPFQYRLLRLDNGSISCEVAFDIHLLLPSVSHPRWLSKISRQEFVVAEVERLVTENVLERRNLEKRWGTLSHHSKGFKNSLWEIFFHVSSASQHKRSLFPLDLFSHRDANSFGSDLTANNRKVKKRIK